MVKTSKKKGKSVWGVVFTRVFLHRFLFRAAVSVARWEQEQCLSEINTTHSEERGRQRRGTQKSFFLKRGSLKKDGKLWRDGGTEGWRVGYK